LLLFIERATDGYDRGRAVCLGVLKGDSEVLRTTMSGLTLTERGRQVVFQVKDDRAGREPVDLGQRIGHLEIKQGLKERDEVIEKFDQNLRASSNVSIKNK
jgi:hypothetical protein